MLNWASRFSIFCFLDNQQYYSQHNHYELLLAVEAEKEFIGDTIDKLDLFICTGYKIGGKNVGEIPFQLNASSIEPQYEKLTGWKMESSTIKDASKLPKEMINYIQYINNKLSAKVQFISNGPGREQIIKLN